MVSIELNLLSGTAINGVRETLDWLFIFNTAARQTEMSWYVRANIRMLLCNTTSTKSLSELKE
jgi:hypothetical protein